MACRPLHFIWICDCSGSMSGKKIESLNFAIRESIKPMQDVAADVRADLLVRAIKFSDRAQWHIAQPTNVACFKWTDLETRPGGRAMAGAL